MLSHFTTMFPMPNILYATYYFLSRSILNIENNPPCNHGDLIFCDLQTDMLLFRGSLPFTLLEIGWSLQSGHLFSCLGTFSCIIPLIIASLKSLFLFTYIAHRIFHSSYYLLLHRQVWKSEDHLQKCVLSSHHGCSRDETRTCGKVPSLASAIRVFHLLLHSLQQ